MLTFGFVEIHVCDIHAWVFDKYFLLNFCSINKCVEDIIYRRIEPRNIFICLLLTDPRGSKFHRIKLMPEFGTMTLHLALSLCCDNVDKLNFLFRANSLRFWSLDFFCWKMSLCIYILTSRLCNTFVNLCAFSLVFCL